jgi:hypothetical protein
MYRCEITGKNSKLGEKLNKVIVITRPKIYFKYVKDETTRIWEKVQAGVGFEPVRELSLSQEGLELWGKMSEEERNIFLKRSV